jgi:cytochrome P450
MATAARVGSERDYFTDKSVLLDPYDYFEELRERGPVVQLESRPDVLFVTGFRESVDVLLDTRNFSSAFNSTGPVVPLPFEPHGDDISDQLEATRGTNPANELMVNYDGEAHVAARSLLNPLLVPSRLKANEDFMWRFADEMVRETVAKGTCEVLNEVATPYVTLVIADLLGVPEADRQQFREVIDQGPPPGNMEAAEEAQQSRALQFMVGYFHRYLTERRANPQDDVMTELALARYPDGTTPDIIEPAKAAMFLFAAGQDTSAKLLGNSIRHLADDKALQQRLREDRSLIPAFIEEMLRLEGSTKACFRVARRTTRIGDVEVPAGKRIVVGLAAANRDPRRWEDPQSFKLDRPRIKEHLAFGRGAHTCAGAPLARVEVRALLDKFLEHTSDISLNEERHGPPGDRRIEYEASYIIRGLDKLYVDLAPR